MSEIVPVVGKKYHVKWGKSMKVTGRCIAVDMKNRTCTLEAPISKKPFSADVKFSDLINTRINEK